MQFLLTLASSLLLPLSLPNEILRYGSTVIGVVALVPLFLVLFRASSRREASRYGALFGTVSTLLSNYWVAFFGDYSVWTLGGPVIGYAGYNYVLFGFLYEIVHGHRFTPVSVPSEYPLDLRRVPAGANTPLLIAVAWTGYEFLKSVGFLGYPWGLIAYPIALIDPIAQIAEITGVWGISFLGSYLNAALAWHIHSGAHRSARRVYGFSASIREATLSSSSGGQTSRWPASFRTPRSRSPLFPPSVRHLCTAVILLALAATFGLYRLPRIAPEEQIDIVLVQQNIDSWKPGRFTDALEQAQSLTVERLQEEIESGAGLPDAVIWSETSLRAPYSATADFYRSEPAGMPFFAFLRLIDTPLITGTPLPAERDGDYHNSAVVILPSGETTGAYGKQQLVPFAESIPFWDVPAVQEFFRRVVGLTGSWVPGTGSTNLPLPLRDGSLLVIGTPICFEDGFGWVPRELVNNGADILVNLTNNSWSRQDSAQTQHYVAARLRSIELRTTLVRGTNSGLSGVVDASGRLVEELPMFVSDSRRVTVPVYPDTWTLYRAWGDWFGSAAAIFTLVFVSVRSIRRNRRGQAGSSHIRGANT